MRLTTIIVHFLRVIRMQPEADPAQVRAMSLFVTVIGSLGIVMGILKFLEPGDWSWGQVLFLMLSVGGTGLGYNRDFFRMAPCVSAAVYMVVVEVILNASALGDVPETSLRFYFSVALQFLVIIALEMIVYNHFTQANTFCGLGRQNLVKPSVRPFLRYSTIALMLLTAVILFALCILDPSCPSDLESTLGLVAAVLCVVWIAVEYSGVVDENLMAVRGCSSLAIGTLLFVGQPTLGSMYLALFVAYIVVGTLLTGDEAPEVVPEANGRPNPQPEPWSEADPTQVRVLSGCVRITGSLGIVMSFLKFLDSGLSLDQFLFLILSVGGSMAIGSERKFFKLAPFISAAGYLVVALVIPSTSGMGDVADNSFLSYFSAAYYSFLLVVGLVMVVYKLFLQTSAFSELWILERVKPWAKAVHVYSSYLTIILMLVTAVISFIRYLGDPMFMGDWESTCFYLAATLCVLWIEAEYRNAFNENQMALRGLCFLLIGMLLFVYEPTLGAIYLGLFVASKFVAVCTILTDIELESEKREDEFVIEEPGFMQAAFSVVGDVFVALIHILLPELQSTVDDAAARRKKSDAAVAQDDQTSSWLRPEVLACVGVHAVLGGLIFLAPYILKLAWFLLERELRTTFSLPSVLSD